MILHDMLFSQIDIGENDNSAQTPGPISRYEREGSIEGSAVLHDSQSSSYADIERMIDAQIALPGDYDHVVTVQEGGESDSKLENEHDDVDQ